jgi:hypothetical protein
MVTFPTMNRSLTAGCGFLLAVLWFDLMHDTQLLRVDPASALVTVRDYYRQVTLTSQPMSILVAAVMLASMVAAWLDLRALTGWRRAGTLALLYLPILAAFLWVLPEARAVASGEATLALSLVLARRILIAHVFCFASVGTFLGLAIARGGANR